jgi:hypothetical protein
MEPCDIVKIREIRFHRLPPGQAEQALRLLQGVENLKVELVDVSTCVRVEYCVCEYTLESLETALSLERFHLDNSLLSRLKRAMAYYCERIQRDNLRQPAQEDKTRKLFVRAYHSQHHGDADLTPQEWREYK